MTDRPPEIHVRDPDGNDVLVGGATLADRTAKLAELEAKWALRAGREAVGDKIHNLTPLARTWNWDWLDANCDPNVALIQFVREQSPNAGLAWGALTTFAKAEALRQGVSYALVENIRMSQALDLLVDVVADLIAAANNVAPPPDR